MIDAHWWENVQWINVLINSDLDPESSHAASTKTFNIII